MGTLSQKTAIQRSLFWQRYVVRSTQYKGTRHKTNYTSYSITSFSWNKSESVDDSLLFCLDGRRKTCVLPPLFEVELGTALVVGPLRVLKVPYQVEVDRRVFVTREISRKQKSIFAFASIPETGLCHLRTFSLRRSIPERSKCCYEFPTFIRMEGCGQPMILFRLPSAYSYFDQTFLLTTAQLGVALFKHNKWPNQDLLQGQWKPFSYPWKIHHKQGEARDETKGQEKLRVISTFQYSSGASKTPL